MYFRLSYRFFIKLKYKLYILLFKLYKDEKTLFYLIIPKFAHNVLILLTAYHVQHIKTFVNSVIVQEVRNTFKKENV